ncbi:nucleotidyltransferase domain-containing protein [Phytoactinopolyspora halotolerans]|uniref:Nucleotidyltransferase domain-containing protein n=1 Tax=Phytoactinopolyspora halotolerans TaxID=1981512 RepID=A0A6L9S8R2_9ACTN|nr:nucleotidyltransferase domain-containing protein [Phytoactinopolyspora halotolerans]NEE00994.1 nucleotidyltransferase domain-containing protein [Phytoactinopolyspora halotolerans]
MDDGRFLDPIADALFSLRNVEAVTLGGSRAQGTHRADSDWDMAIYYRGDFQPQELRDLGWDGTVSELGEWGGGVFNGGAWLRVEDRPVDVHYRDLDVVEQQIVRSRAGQFHIEPLMFHLVGIPSYLVVGELAINRVLRGSLPEVAFPDPLRHRAREVWSGQAELTLTYAEHNHAPAGRAAQCAGMLAVAASQYAHAILASRGEWITNEKTLLDRSGLRAVDDVIVSATREPESLTDTVAQVRRMGRAQLAVA